MARGPRGGSAPRSSCCTWPDDGGPAPLDASGSIGLGAQDALLQELVELDARRAEITLARGERLLAATAAGIDATGLEVITRQRHGRLREVLVEVEADTRLFVMGLRGTRGGASGHDIGGQVEPVLRAVQRPVLLAQLDAPARPIQRVLVAFDGSETARRAVERIAASPLLRGLECHLLLAGGDAGQERALVEVADALHASGFAPELHRASLPADDAIVAHISRLDADLLVMGAYGHSRLREWFLGSTTGQVLRRSPVPLLILR
ncbi:universal stress protein [Luteimonas yindakuii]|uniref:universal stress protein n=1 Tax=Luteimonas yindakuii TaxID=2565782 RepID=UPI0011078ABF|nr:universal stress protein [Luteimonas yindakuii]QCO66874.2 universal stress protein [Luteimonas yindakuii]